jgi:BlaI family penicillinase repressor
VPRSRRNEQLTPLEHEIMQVLWETSPASVTDVQQRLEASRPLAYTTVQTMLNVLWKKGKVKRALVERAYHYRPVLTRTRAAQEAVRAVIDRVFGGSAEELVMNLVETKRLTPEALRRLQQTLDDQETGDGRD